MAIEKIFKDFIRFAQCNELKIEGIAIADENRVILEHRFLPDQGKKYLFPYEKLYVYGGWNCHRRGKTFSFR